MPYPKYNKKSEEDPRKERSNPEYPWVTGSVDIGGKEEINYVDPNSPETAFSHKLHYSGAFETDENAGDDKNGLKNTLNHEVRSYSSGGTSSTSDGNSDEALLNENGSKRRNYAGDDGTSTKGDRYSGAGGSNIGGTSQGGYTDHNGDSYVNTVGNHSYNHEGDISQHFDGDHTTSTNGNMQLMLGKGEYGIHVQKGNMDIKVDEGKYKVESKSEMYLKCDSPIEIQSASKITIKVGSSTVVLESGQITIKSGAIKFEKA